MVHLDASVFMPLFNLQVILTAFFAFLVLGERYSLISYLFMGAIVLGGILVSADEHLRFKLSRPLVLFLAGIIFYSLSDAFGGSIVKDFGALNLRFWSSLLLVLFSLCLIPFFRVKETVSVPKLFPAFFIGFFGFLGLVSLTTGFISSVSLSQALSRLSSVYALILIVVLARFKGDFLEKRNLKVYALRFLGCLFMVLSAIGLVFIR